MRRALAIAATVAVLGVLPGGAAADPLPLRHGAPSDGFMVEAGWPHVGVGWWPRPDLGLAAGWRLPAAAVSGSVGTRRRAELGSGPWVVDGFLAGGLLVPTLDPGLAVTVTPAVQLTRDGAHTEWTLGLAIPMELGQLPARRLRVPTLLELGVGLDLGRLDLGVRAGTGPVLSVPGITGFALQGSFWACVPLRSVTDAR